MVVCVCVCVAAPHGDGDGVRGGDEVLMVVCVWPHTTWFPTQLTRRLSSTPFGCGSLSGICGAAGERPQGNNVSHLPPLSCHVCVVVSTERPHNSPPC